MDYEFIWLLPLALLVIPAAVCYVLFSKINALGDSLDIITEELSALQKMIRDSRKEYRKPAGPAKKTIVEEREQTAENTPAEMRQETAKTSGEEAPVPHAPAAYWWEQSEPIRPSVVEIPVKEKDERKQETIGQETEPAGQKEDTTEQAADRQDRKPFPAADRPVRSSEEDAARERQDSGLSWVMSHSAEKDTARERQDGEPPRVMDCSAGSSEEDAASDREEAVFAGQGTNYEKFIGENLFGKIGIIVFIIGIGFFVKYAIDQNWINETARAMLGYAVGAGMLVLAERLHRRYHTFTSLLAGGAFGVFYLITAIAFHYYGLFSQTMAFVILCATTLFMSGISILYDRKELAVTALVGGFLAPFIVSTDSDSVITLQIYISLLNIGMFALAMYRKWGILPIVAFCFTYVILWMTTLAGGWQFLLSPTGYTILLGFATLFYFIFLFPVIFILRTPCSKSIRRAMLSVVTGNSFLYLLYGDYVLRRCGMSFDNDGFIAFFIAAVNLAAYLYLRFRISGQDTLRSLMLGLTITFVSIGIPMQFDTTNLLMMWATEAVLLLWLFTREKDRIFETGAVVLSVLTLVSLLLCRLLCENLADTGHSLFFNGNFLVMLFLSISSFVFAVILQRHRALFSEDHRLISYAPCNAVAYSVGFLLLYLGLWDDFHFHLENVVADLASLLALNVLLSAGAGILRNRFEIDRYRVFYDITVYFAAGLYAMAVWNYTGMDGNLLKWIMTCVTAAYLIYVMRGLLLAMPDNRKQHTEFAIISTLVWLTATRLLMVTFNEYGFSTAFSLSLGFAAFTLMCVGMRCHSKQVRIVSLTEFGIVLGKLVLNDVWSMPALGKIIVFISLGILLLTLSFLYQKLKDVLFKEEEEK